MKYLLLLTCACIFYAHISRAQLTDDFSDGNFSENPVWIPSDDSDWIVNNGFQLQSNHKIISSKFWISTPQTIADSAVWEFDIQLNFNPSSTNYMDVYVMSSHQNPTDSVCTGYFVRIGNTKDEIALYRKDRNNKITKLIDGTDGLLNKASNVLSIKVIRRKNKGWQLYYDLTQKRNAYALTGSTSDTTYIASNYFILFVQQSTASFFQKHFIDNIQIAYYIPDLTPPYIVQHRINDNKSISIQFSENVSLQSVFNPNNFILMKEEQQPIAIYTDSTTPKTCICLFEQPFQSGNNYQLLVKNIEDESGNFMKDTIIDFSYYIAKEKDIIINEIMFDPVGSGSDYIEILNRSAFPVNLKNYRLANRNNSNSLTNTTNLFSNDRFIMPGSYLVFTEDSFNIISSFRVSDPEHLIQIPDLPSMPNDRGTIVLLDDQERIMDELSYDDGWHFALLNQREGVALERIDANKPTNQPDNWMSASKTSGYGTPTAPNSQQYSSGISDETISLSNKIFSPDHDGYEDVLMIDYRFPEGGYVLNAIVFDIAGRPVRTLQKQLLCGINGSFRWDGLDDQNRQLPMGHYILFCEVFNLRGRVKRYKKEVVLARRW